MEGIESQLADWRAYISEASAVDGHDVEELEAHLRDQIGELEKSGLTTDEAYLVAVKRMGEIDTLAREFAVEHSERLWKQLVVGGTEPERRMRGGGAEAVAFALLAAAAIQVARLAADFPEETSSWLARNASLFVLPFLAGYLARRRSLDSRGWALTALPFLAFGLVANLYPYEADSTTEVLVALHLPVLLWFATAIPYMGGRVRSHDRRMDFVRFTGEWFIYYVLIALGGGVLMLLTGLILEPIRTGLAEDVIVWILPSGAAAGVVVAAWLVESKQQVIENMAPVLTMLFTPLFAVMLSVAAVTYALFGFAGAFDRELLGVFDALLVVVLGLVLYSMSARDSSRPAGLADRVQLVAVLGALLLDVMVLAAMIVRIDDLGFTQNRTVALGLNLVLLVNLAWSAVLSLRFTTGKTSFHTVERWQTSYLPVFAAWAAIVVAVIPPIFGFS